MVKLITLAAIVLLCIVAVYLVKVVIESAFNIHAMLDDKNRYDRTKRKNGIVFNTQKGRLEADQSFMPPF